MSVSVVCSALACYSIGVVREMHAVPCARDGEYLNPTRLYPTYGRFYRYRAVYLGSGSVFASARRGLFLFVVVAVLGKISDLVFTCTAYSHSTDWVYSIH